MGGLHEQVVQTPCHVVHYCCMSAVPSLQTYGRWCGNVSITERVVALTFPTESLVKSPQNTDKRKHLEYGHSGKCILIHCYCK